MKGIYLTQEGKAEIEAKIAERRKYSPIENEDDWYENGELNVYKEILASAIIIPVEKSWLESLPKGARDHEDTMIFNYPNGVIIQPKKQ